MQTPQFINGQFLDQTALNQVATLVLDSIAQVGSLTNTPGLVSPSSLTFGLSLNTVTVTAPAPFGVVFTSGLMAQAFGTTDGATSDVVTLNFAPLIPGSGSVTAFIIASITTIQALPFEDTGPPIGHPDFNPNFVPVLAYASVLDSLLITASTTPANNTTTFELGRTTLTHGQTSITSITTTSQVFAGSILNHTGVAAGTYAGATVTVGVDGRITGVVAEAYGLLAGSQTWTGVNTFTDPNTGAIIIKGNASNGANIAFVGNGSTTPNKFIRAEGGFFSVVNNAYTAEVWQVDDSGNATVFGNETIAGNLNVSTNAGISGTLSVGGNAGVTGTLTVASSAAVGALASNTSITAVDGARGSGNGDRVPILNDWEFEESSPGFRVCPDGFELQWGTVLVPPNTVPTTFDFVISFANVCLAIVISYEASTPPTSGNVGAQPLNGGQFTATNSAVGGGGNNCQYIAFGF